MDLKTGAKWIGILVAAGLISTVIEIALTRYVKVAATQAAKEETERIITAAVQQLQAQQPQPRVMPETEKSSGYAVNI
jgi:mannose/fructose/N-acetylgalactosamine-specific phosphotransferase system component IID